MKIVDVLKQSVFCAKRMSVWVRTLEAAVGRFGVLMGSVFLSTAVTAGELLGPEGGDGWSIWYEEVSSDNLPWLMDMPCAYFSKQSADGPYYRFKTQLGYSSSIVPPDNLPGYKFKQWLVERMLADWGGDPDDYAVCLYAQWEKVSEVRKIHFDMNDEWFRDGNAGSILNANIYPATGTMDDLSYVDGRDVTLPRNKYARDGFEFAGWAKAKNFNAVYQDGATIKANELPTSESGLVLYAVWKAKTVVITLDYREWSGASQNIKTKTATTGYGVQMPWFPIDWSTSDIIGGWYTSPSGGTRVDTGTWWVPTKDTTYYLQWRHKTCTIKYKANGGTGSMPNQSFTMGINQRLSLNQFQHDGYVFSGWAKSSDGAVVYTDGEGVLLPTAIDGGTVTLYAVWTAVQSYFEIVNGVLKKYKGPGGAVTIPSSVTSIGDYAFYNCSGLTSVTIPSSVTSIGDRAFGDCRGLVSVTIPSSVTSMGYHAFGNCSGLTSVTIPSSMTTIGELAFAGCSGLTSVVIPSSVTSIGSYAFSGCGGLTSVKIPSNLMSIGDHAFYYCSGLTSVTIPSSVTIIGDSAFSYCSGLTSVTISEGVTSIGRSMFSSCSELISVTIPSSVTSIGDYAFFYCNSLTSVTIPSSVKSIGEYAFSVCRGLTSVTISDGVTSIGESAFSNCSGLTSVTIPSNVTSIGDEAFYGCFGLKTVYVFPGDTKRVRNMMSASGFSVGNVEFVETLTEYTVSFNANGGSGMMTSQTITYGVSTALKANTFTKNGYTFAGWSKTAGGSVAYANGATVSNLASAGGAITLYAVWTAVSTTYTVTFNANGGSGTMTSQTITYGVSTALKANTFTKNGYTFAGWSKTAGGSVAYANGATVSNLALAGGAITLYAVWTAAPTTYTVSFNANGGAGTMTSQTITYGVSTSLKANSFTRSGYTFAGWSKTVGGLVAYIDGTSVSNLASAGGAITLYAVWTAVQSESDFEIANGVLTEYKGPGGAVAIPSGVTSIDDYAFKDCIGLTSVTIPSGVRSIGYGAFFGCSGLKSVIIPSSVKRIGEIAFCDCSGLTQVVIPSGVTSIGDGAFAGCSGLTSVTIPTSVTSIGEAAFSDCIGLTSVKIPSSVTSIGVDVFCYCTSLEDITIPSSVTSIGEGAFYGCCGLDSVKIPSSVTSIGGYAFSLCEGLTSVIIPPKVTSIGEGAFYGCSGLESVTIPPSVTIIGHDAFSLGYDPITLHTCTALITVYVNSGDISRVRNLMTNCGLDCGSITFLEIANTYTVVFNANGGTGTMQNQQITYCTGTQLSANAFTRSGYVFTGWAKTAEGQVVYADKESVTDIADAGETITLYAIWDVTGLVDPAETHIDAARGEVAPYEKAAAVYDGYLYDADGNVAGTVQVKVAKIKNGAAKATATVQLADGTKKLSFKGGVADAAGGVTEMADKNGNVLAASLGVNGLGGELRRAGSSAPYRIDGARNIFSAKDAKAMAAAVENAWVGAVNVVGGDVALAVSIAKKGKMKVSGTVGGAKVSATSQLLVGDGGVCCVPVVITKKANLAFNLWLLPDGGVELAGLDGVEAGKAGALKPGAAFSIEDGGDALAEALPELLDEFLPDGVEVAANGKKWIVAPDEKGKAAKAGKVALDKKTGKIDESKLGANPSGLKLTYTAKTGTFKGSFKAYAMVGGKLKSYTVNVTGVMLGDKALGTATLKKPAVSFPIAIE